MRVAVTGASGTIGPVVIAELTSRGHHVVAAPSSSTLDFLGDVLRVVDWLTTASPEAIVHLAGSRPPADPVRLFGINCGSISGLLDGVTAVGGRPHIVYISSAAVYGRGAYGASKRAAERLAQSMCEGNNVPLTVLRVFNVVAPRESHSLLADFYERFRNDLPEANVRDADSVRDFIDVRDVAAAIAFVLDHRLLGTHDVGSGDGTSVMDAVTQLAREMGATTRLLPQATPSQALRSSIADRGELWKHGWTPRFPFRESLREFVRARGRADYP